VDVDADVDGVALVLLLRGVGAVGVPVGRVFGISAWAVVVAVVAMV
jgi:hypothetical protein